MNFILKEVKLWFQDGDVNPLSYEFEPNKINVITGDSSTGKTSFLNIIDYCLLSGIVQIPNEISEKVSWFGIRFFINQNEISIARKSPSKEAPSSEVYFNRGDLPQELEANSKIGEIKSLLDIEFGITDAVRFKKGRSSLNLSYRHFLILNTLTYSIIAAKDIYFDTGFYGKEEYERILKDILEMVMGIDDIEGIQAKEKIQEIDSQLSRNNNQNSKIYELIEECKNNGLINPIETFNQVEDAKLKLEEVIEKGNVEIQNTNIFSEKDKLIEQRREIQQQVNLITSYQKAYKKYIENIGKSADSLQPIEFLKQKLADQLIDSFETTLFINSLESSLKNIRESISIKPQEPIKVDGDLQELKNQLRELDSKISQINELNNFKPQAAYFKSFGKIDYIYKQVQKGEKKRIDSTEYNHLIDLKNQLNANIKNNEEKKFRMKTLLNECIQRYCKLQSTLPWYELKFNYDKLILQAYNNGAIYPIENIGSSTNEMFMHLCFYLGLHNHIVFNNQEKYVPQYLFIDQLSQTCSGGSPEDLNNMKDAFSLLNKFMETIIVQKQSHFQILLIEHCSKDRWAKLEHFHTVDEFINGKGLIPRELYKNNL